LVGLGDDHEAEEEMTRSNIPGRRAVVARGSVFLGTATVILLGLLPAASTSVAASAAPRSVHPANCGKMNAEFVPACGLWWGASASKQAWPALEKETGRKLAIVHEYADWTTTFPTANERTAAAGGRIVFVDWSPATASGGVAATWASIAKGTWDKQLRAEAKLVKAFGKPMMVTFQSEPELTRVRPYGSAAQYVAAWRHIFDVFRFEGVKNVAWVWDVTGDVTDHGAAYPSWYPGDFFVNWIMWDPYNWYSCIHKGGTWESFAQKVESMYSWLTSHSGKRGNGDYLSKPWGIGETGTVEGKTATAKAKWFESSVSAIRSTFPRIRAVIWSDTDDITAGRSCNWSINSSKDSLAGFKSAGKQSYASPLPTRA
jgi:hypothetical protein